MRTLPPFFPEGKLRIAQSFSFGLRGATLIDPEGRAEHKTSSILDLSIVPSGLTSATTALPNPEALGYSRLSLRDNAAALF